MTWWIGVLAVVAAAGLMIGGAIVLRSPAGPRSPAAATSAASPIVARLSIPRVGDCGSHRRGTVTPVACSDVSADVVVADRLVLGDPQMLCPLFDRTSVLATAAGESFTVCWVPTGGGPERRFGPATVRGVATTEPSLPLGTCGDVHDQHVHAPQSCDDTSADGVVVMVLGANDDPGSCPSQRSSRSRTLPVVGAAGAPTPPEANRSA
ncbi:MAG TPA: hypothetical protein VLB31_07165 [Actinomycetota bacterium]|nr:hypothetical protein [Actinomycetota bacterium]